jgi:hypothetical protein
MTFIGAVNIGVTVTKLLDREDVVKVVMHDVICVKERMTK